MSNEKHFSNYNGYGVDCMGSAVSAFVSSYIAADGERLIIFSIPDIEGKNSGAVIDGDAEICLSPQQAKQLAWRLLKLATEKIDMEDDEPTAAPLLTPELEKAWR